MHELLEALGYVLDALLTPFTQGAEPPKTWMKVTGLILAALLLIILLGLGITLLS